MISDDPEIEGLPVHLKGQPDPHRGGGFPDIRGTLDAFCSKAGMKRLLWLLGSQQANGFVYPDLITFREVPVTGLEGA